MWAYESVFYQIYPLGFCGAPFENDGVLTPRIRKVIDWIPHIKNLGANAIYFSPVFESDTHGYNTRDFRKIDVRLGTNEDFADVCQSIAQGRNQSRAGRRIQSCRPRILGISGCPGKTLGFAVQRLVPYQL